MTARLPDGRPPRGMRPNGMVRTAGPGVWFTLTGFLLALPFNLPWLPFPFAAAGFGLWRLWIRYVRPSSRAVNLVSAPASELRPGDWFRPYGGFGPACQVAETRLDQDDLVHVSLRGGRELTLAPDYRVRRVRLRN